MLGLCLSCGTVERKICVILIISFPTHKATSHGLTLKPSDNQSITSRPI